jgi:hypothetical protein
LAEIKINEVMRNLIKIIICIFICKSIVSCTTPFYPEERFAIDPEFRSIFKALTQKDSVVFEDSAGHHRGFVFTKPDSIENNTKGWFINARPYKIIEAHYNEFGQDTIKPYFKTTIYVHKDPASKCNTLCIKFNLFYFFDSILPPPRTDTLKLRGREFTHYYAFKSTFVRSPADIEVVYIDKKEGFLALVTRSRIVWLNKSLRNGR